MSAVAQWQVEFPDFSGDSMPVIPEAWDDQSWHNDVCPSFVALVAEPSEIRVWVDYPDPQDREFPDWPRFRAYVAAVDGSDSEEIIVTDRWADLLAAVEAKRGEMA